MVYDICVSSLDELNTPIIMCDPEGVVIYKNEAAVKEVRLPKRHTHVQPHLHPDDAMTLTSLERIRKPCMMTVNTGERKVRAFVTAYDRKGTECSLWIFPAIIQINSKTKYTYCIESGMIDAAGEICDIIKGIDEKSFSASPKTQASVDKRLKKKVDSVITGIFYGGGESLYPLYKGVNLLADAANRTFAKFGYEIRNELIGIPDKHGSGSYIDFKSFSLFYYHLIAYFIESGVGKTMNVRFSRDDSNLYIDLVLSMPYPPFYAENESNLARLAELSPTSIIDLLMFEKFAMSRGYSLSFSINEEHLGNLSVSAAVPIVKRMEFRERSAVSEIDELLLESDIVTMYYFMFRFRGFVKPEEKDA